MSPDFPYLIARIQFLFQLLDLAHVAKRLHAAYDLPGLVPEQRRANHHGNAAALAVDDIGGGVENAFFELHGPAKGAILLAHAGAKHSPAMLADGLLPWRPGNIFRRPVKRRDPPLVIDGEHPFGNALQDNLGDVVFFKRRFFSFHDATFYFFLPYKIQYKLFLIIYGK